MAQHKSSDLKDPGFNPVGTWLSALGGRTSPVINVVKLFSGGNSQNLDLLKHLKLM